MVLQKMLETCRSTEEAVEYITHAKRGGHDAVLTLADPSARYILSEYFTESRARMT
jgi:hypothetical protein